MFLLSLALIFTLGFFGGWLFNKLRLPKLVWYLVLGILIGPSLLNIVDKSLLDISSILRQIALVIILTRSGLSLDLTKLKEVGRSAILMCFIPATFEIIGIVIFGPLLLKISLFESMLLGSVLAAVSPAVVVPRMIKLKEEGYGTKHHVSELILAGASVDDIYVIILFYAFKTLVSTSSFNYITLLNIPLSIILGIVLGIVVSIIVLLTFKYMELNKYMKVLILLGVSLLMLYIEEILKPYFSISSLLGIIVLGIIILKFDRNSAVDLKKSYNKMWSVFEILLFVLVGCATDIKYAFSIEGAIILGLIGIGLIFRTIGVLLCVICTQYTFKEKMFIIFSYLPKATVQASIGAIALSEGLGCGVIVLTSAVIAIIVTAPIGAFLMDLAYKKLLIKDGDIEELHNLNE